MRACRRSLLSINKMYKSFLSTTYIACLSEAMSFKEDQQVHLTQTAEEGNTEPLKICAPLPQAQKVEMYEGFSYDIGEQWPENLYGISGFQQPTSYDRDYNHLDEIKIGWYDYFGVK